VLDKYRAPKTNGILFFIKQCFRRYQRVGSCLLVIDEPDDVVSGQLTKKVCAVQHRVDICYK
jgi:hypothetical protein